jgi:MYXO-CTERM domain-containing protein
MGLGEELREDGASMYYRSHRCETQKRTLAASDEQSAMTLYTAPASEDSDDAEASAGCSASGGGAPGSSAVLAFVTLLGVALLGARRRG